MKLTTLIGLLTVAILTGSCSSDPALTIKTSLSSTARAAATRDCDREPCSGSPLNFTIKLYRAYASTNEDCSGAVQVVDHGTTGADVVIGTDNLLQADPAAGTYKCLILKMSDQLKFVPDSTAVAAFPGVCVAGTQSTFDIYRTTSGDSGQWKDIDGNTYVATGNDSTPGDDVVWIFASTSASALSGSSIAPHTNQSANLNTALVVPGQTTFYVDFRNGIAGSSICKIEGGTGMGFR